MTIAIEELAAERNIYRNLVAFAPAMDERDWVGQVEIFKLWLELKPEESNQCCMSVMAVTTYRNGPPGSSASKG
jgi:hypothetical protein